MSRQTTEMMKRTGSLEPVTPNPEPKEIEALAYQLWLLRGCSVGSDHDDWFRAEDELKKIKSVQQAA